MMQWLGQQRARMLFGSLELWLMWQLEQGAAGISSACWQVKLKFWAAPFDFMMLDKRVIIQADGSCHFEGMYEQSSWQEVG
jgi:hypothetical protein